MTHHLVAEDGASAAAAGPEPTARARPATPRQWAPPPRGIDALRRRADLPEVRWAAVALLAFAVALAADLAGWVAWVWAPPYAACYLAGGWASARRGLAALRERTLDVDLLMIVAALGAAAIGQVRDGGLLIVIFATSGALEAVATRATADSVRDLLDLTPDTATRVQADGTEQVVPAATLTVGDVVLVRPGERIGADGTVLAGTSEVDQATITGEALPAAKEPGDEVFAGTLNTSGALRVRVDRDPRAWVVARIVALVEEASRAKAPTQRFVEAVEQRYSVGVVAATLALVGVPLLAGAALEPTLLRAMTFMIVASPCAVVLATMPPLLAAIASGGRHGVLVKSPAVMERLGAVTATALDKTGTLTEGRPQLDRVRTLPGAALDADDVLSLAAGAEHPSEHPLARVIVQAARARGLPVPAAEDFTSFPGVGVRATVSGRHVEVGSPRHLLAEHLPAAERPRAQERTGATPTEARAAVREVAEFEDAGHTAVAVVVDGTPAGVLGVTDRLRPDARRAVSALAAFTATPPVMLTGDNPRAAGRLAAQAGIADVRAGLLPQDKVAAVRELAAAGHNVLVVGDGVNDAPALAAAHTGIAMGTAGSDLTLQTADAVVARDELAAIPATVALARRARRTVVQNLAIAGVCIAVLVTWDLAGHLPLPLGVAGHEGSTLLVALNGLRLLRENAWTHP